MASPNVVTHPGVMMIPKALKYTIGLWALACNLSMGMRDAHAQQDPGTLRLPAICHQQGIPEAIRELIHFCPAGRCEFRNGMGDAIERRVNPDTLQRISSSPQLYPVRIFYKKNHGRFEAADLISADHYRHVQSDVQELVRTYGRFPGSKIVVLGRASLTGDPNRNSFLSQERARKFADYLETQFRIPVLDIHQAYFGSQLFQIQLGDMAGLGVSTEDLRREADGNSDPTIAANQSVVAFVFPCPDDPNARRPPPEVVDEKCPIDADAGAHEDVPRVDASRPRFCETHFGDDDGGVPNDVYLIGGPVSQLFTQYVGSLGARYGGRDLRTLVVHYPVNENGQIRWLSKSGVTSWMTQDLVGAWTTALENLQAAEVAPPEHLTNADILCNGVTPNNRPRAPKGICSVSGVAGEGSVGGVAALLMLGLLVAHRRRRARV